MPVVHCTMSNMIGFESLPLVMVTAPPASQEELGHSVLSLFRLLSS